MKIFDSSDLVTGQMYFCVYESMVYYVYAVQDERFSDLFAMFDHEHKEVFHAHECSLIYQL